MVRRNRSRGEGIDRASERGGFDPGEGAAEVDETRCCSKRAAAALLPSAPAKHADVAKVNYSPGGPVPSSFSALVLDRSPSRLRFGETVVRRSGSCCILVQKIKGLSVVGLQDQGW